MADSIPDNNENSSWAEKEFRNANIGDKRLQKRLVAIAEHFANNPQAQIPQAMESFGGAKSAYRFFDNKKVTIEKILKPHVGETTNRIKGNITVLSIQDTTVLDYSSHRSVTNIGPIISDTNRGFILHPTLVVSLENIPLGLIDFNIWVREEEKKKKDYHRTIEEKESYKWINSYLATAKLEKELKVQEDSSKKLPKIKNKLDKLTKTTASQITNMEALYKRVDGASKRERIYEQALKMLKQKKPGWVKYAEASLKLTDLAVGAGFTDFSEIAQILVLVDSIGVEVDDLLVEQL